MLYLLPLMAATAQPLPQPSEARQIVEWQLRSPPRPDTRTKLSTREADAIIQAYLRSIGQRLDDARDRGGTP